MANDVVITIRLPAETKADWQSKAKSSGMSLTDWVTFKCLEGEPVYTKPGRAVATKTPKVEMNGRKKFVCLLKGV